jgi:class 3 adenylate cyclase
LAARSTRAAYARRRAALRAGTRTSRSGSIRRSSYINADADIDLLLPFTAPIAELLPRRVLARPPVRRTRVLATVLFTDIVSSTELAEALGDAPWRELLEHHDAHVREEVRAQGGHHVKSLGDGALALFDAPSRAIACAVAIDLRMRALCLQTRAGLHTGECELVGRDDVGGIAVHIAARIAALAKPGEVLASGTVRDLSMGSRFTLENRGEAMLKGIAEPWRVFAVAA